MIYKPHIYTGVLDINRSTPTSTAKPLIIIAKNLIDIAINEVLNDTFNYEKYPWGRVVGSNLTGKSGLYLIINKVKKRVYLGSTQDLSQRKGEHSFCFRNQEYNTRNDQRVRIPPKMREDSANGQVTDFHFVPLLIIATPDIQLGPELTISQFLDQHVESLLLTDYLSESHPHANLFYNSKTVGQFQTGQQVTRSPLSGQAKAAIAYRDIIAWSSVSLAADMLDVDRGTVRNRRTQGILNNLSSGEFDDFTGTKIKNSEEAQAFIQNNPEAYSAIRSALSLRNHPGGD